MSEWIKCSDQMPDDDTCVIASGFIFNDKVQGRWVEPCFYAEDDFYAVGTNEDGGASPNFDIVMHPPTHWMPLPEPPQDA
ncbi:DUF551 domain-containing protein [Pseudomonas aeruginosa]|uniref:DUF551 domain-containing protein n=1 Tax=Pseudomonas aeruginosa TaxID=287 RepID=UPI0021E9754E|nr:DUF551 domain-containing protein [Pseudomonas aeruginosa]MCV3851692.1 DUF551 domain-containing protein [Pseudomonas aeruginosa]MCV3857723.1 DUF551 domain-containing protein [Pseudomonas aeruginosa]HCI1953207.1 DUF551 domain-containing protein [Pseudomonas aeruginosa]